MGEDKIRHLLPKRRGDGMAAYYWNPSKTLRDLGLKPEPLGTDYAHAKARALELNAIADEMRRFARTGGNGPAPGTNARLFRDFRASPEFADLKPRTQKDYSYYLDKIEAEFAHLPVAAWSPRVVKEYYRRLVTEKGIAWSYHMIGTLRAVLSWAVTEDWIPKNPALDVRIKAPRKRTVIWQPEQAAAYTASAAELGWHSIVAMAHVFDSIGQSPVDVRTLRRGAYDGRAIASTRAKTGRTDAPIPLFPEAKAALDAYLATRPALLPEAPLFANDRTGGEWVESTLAKHHAEIRAAAGLPKELQLQDFRRTAATEGGAAGLTADELRGLQRHSTRTAALHYVHPDARFVEAAQEKRQAHRNKTRPKVRTAPE